MPTNGHKKTASGKLAPHKCLSRYPQPAYSGPGFSICDFSIVLKWLQAAKSFHSRNYPTGIPENFCKVNISKTKTVFLC